MTRQPNPGTSCDFCGSTKEQAVGLMLSYYGCICYDCVRFLHDEVIAFKTLVKPKGLIIKHKSKPSLKVVK